MDSRPKYSPLLALTHALLKSYKGGHVEFQIATCEKSTVFRGVVENITLSEEGILTFDFEQMFEMTGPPPEWTKSEFKPEPISISDFDVTHVKALKEVDCRISLVKKDGGNIRILMLLPGSSALA
jgi:hypothetical protein